MTGHDHDHDENAPENLGPNEGLDPFFEQGPQQKGKQKPKPRSDEESPDDVLFAAPEGEGEGEGDGESIANPGAPFQERGRTPWGGRGLSPDEIGIPVEGQQSHLEGDDDLGIDSEQELELVDEVEAQGDEVPAGEEELVLEDSEAVAEAAEHLENSTDDPLAGEVFVLDDGEVAAEAEGEGEFAVDGSEEGGSVLAEEPLPADNYPVEDGWEPVATAQEDPQDDLPAEGEVEAETEAPVEEEAIASSGDEFTRRRQFSVLASETAESPELVTAAPGPRRSWFGRAAASVAAAAVLGAAGVAVLEPQWLGLSFEPELVERVQVARPETTPKVKPPVVPSEPKVEPQPTTEPKVEPKTEPAAKVEPQPVPSEPTEPRPQPQPQAETAPGDQIEPPELPRYLPAGESMWIGQFETSQPTENDWANVRPGGKAFAQLQNGNFFIGSVKGVAADALILVVKQGEVTLPRAEVTRITGLDTSDYSVLQKATAGFLKLSNKNRLVGQILETVDDDHYVLQMRSDRIVVPRSTVEKVVQQPGSENLRFGSTGDEEGWLRELAERQLQSERTGKVAPTVPPAQKLRDEPVRPLPVQKTGRKAPTDGR